MNSILDLAPSPAESAASIPLAGGGSDACAEWRSIPGWPEYQVSDTGAVRRVGCASGARVGRILRQLRNKKTGYFSVCLSQHAVQVRIDVHRLVAMAFHGPQAVRWITWWRTTTEVGPTTTPATFAGLPKAKTFAIAANTVPLCSVPATP